MAGTRKTVFYSSQSPLAGQEEVEKQLCGLICRLFFLNPDEFCGRSVFKEELGLDSLDLLELIMHIEREFRVELADGEWTGLKNSTELAQLIAIKASSRS